MEKKVDGLPAEISIQDYLKDRLFDQMNYYDRKSVEAQNKYRYMRRIEILSAALIPFLTGFAHEKILGIQLNIVVGILGIIIAVVAGLLALNKYQDIWVEYRTTTEALKHHLFLFQTKAGPYGGSESERFERLVENVEGLLSKEKSDWSAYIRHATQDKQRGKS